MTEPSRPVPDPPRPGAAAPAEAADEGPARDTAEEQVTADRFADLDQRPVAEHVAVFEAEHERLRRELGTIDQL